MSVFYLPFGYLLKLCCTLAFNEYVLALLFFAIIMQVILFPLGIKQQKSSVNMQKIKPKEQIIREKYSGRNDRPTQIKMQQEIQELYQKEGVSQFSGCLPLLIQLPIILILFAVVRYPLTYCVAINDAEFVENQYTTAIGMFESAKSKIADSEYYKDKTKDQAKYDELHTLYDNFVNIQTSFGATIDEKTKLWNKEEDLKSPADAYAELNLVGLMQGDADEYEELLETKYGIKDAMGIGFAAEDVERLPSFGFIGDYTFLNIPNQYFGAGLGTIAIMLIIPVLVFVSSYFGGVFTRKFSGMNQTQPNGAPAPGNGKFMKWGMPAISAYFALTFPLAIGAYWIFRTVLQALQQYILAKMYPMPVITEEDIKEARRLYKGKKKKVITIEVDEDDTTYDSMIIDTKSSSNDTSVPSTKFTMLTGDEPSDEPKVKPEGKVEKAAMKKDDKIKLPDDKKE